MRVCKYFQMKNNIHIKLSPNFCIQKYVISKKQNYETYHNIKSGKIKFISGKRQPCASRNFGKTCQLQVFVLFAFFSSKTGRFSVFF